MNRRSISSDSRNTQAEIDRTQISIKNGRTFQRKISIQNIEQNFSDNLYGRLSFENYELMRGFIDGRGKGVRLHYMKFEPYKKIASICIFHGYGERCSDYLDIANYYANNNMVVHMLDLRGFGLSGAHKQHDGLTSLYYDIETLIKCCQSGLPIYLFCHGFGATLVMSLLTDNTHLPINGLILLAPTFKFPQQNNSVTQKICKFICRTFFGDLLVNNHINPTGLTKNNQIVKKIIDNGCNLQYIKLRFMQQIQIATSYVLQNANKINYPILIYSGTANTLQNNYPTQQYFSSINSKDKTFRSFSNGYHALHQDEQCQSIKKHSIDWIYQRIKNYKNIVKMTPLKINQKPMKRIHWRGILSKISLIVIVLKILRVLQKRLKLL